MTYREGYCQGRERLLQAGIDEAELEARLLLEYVCGTNRNDLLAHGDMELEAYQEKEYVRLIGRRVTRIPLQHLTGNQEFMGLSFRVNEHVLIPRQDTETLVEEVMRYLNDGMRILDLCTGSGCILLSLLRYSNSCQGLGSDLSAQALEVARENAGNLSLNAEFVQSDLFEKIEGKFEIIVSNPPYSIKWEGDDNPVLINDPRFSPAGVLAPKSKAGLAFIMHSLAWLATSGTAAIVCFPGIMYRGGAEKKIRQYLIDNNFIDCIIQLPSNLFFGTSIATCIMVLKRSKSDNKTLFIDASNEFVKVTNNNRLTEENIAHIVDEFVSRNGTQHFSHLANYDEIKAQDYNLSVSTYVEQEDTREVIDIVKLNAEIEEIVAREQILRAEIAKIIAEIEGQK